MSNDEILTITFHKQHFKIFLKVHQNIQLIICCKNENVNPPKTIPIILMYKSVILYSA